MLSVHVFALKTKIVTFEQFLKLDQEHAAEMEFTDVSPSTQAWTAIYVVGKQTIPNRTAQMSLVILPEGLINKASPTEKINQTILVADDLPLRKKFSLKEFDDIADEIKEQTGKEIEDPFVKDADVIRTYAQVMDWVPEYGVENFKLSIAVPEQQGFEPLAIYMIVGEGDKPKQVMDLMLQNNNMSAEERQQQFRNASKSPDSMMAKMEARFLIFLVIAAVMIFVLWGKFRRD
ncbi:hypothetical protein CDG68_04195 [Acinetobacter wuhouensis]|uniref:Uncharacterized protein n=2 Tax=Acinetobacter wuhouensis TaxID=1879050 RepID=A0A3G2SYY4_9GAMM|nr:hypothetical protein CDG68_04195 [Acinetobacter wuhouensis]